MGRSDLYGYMGIDPGLDGYIAVLDSDGGWEFHEAPTLTRQVSRNRGGKRKKVDARQPDERAMSLLLWDIKMRYTYLHGGTRRANLFAALESVSAMPSEIKGQKVSMGTQSAFNFGAGWGLWRGLLRGHLGDNYRLVHPLTWTAYFKNLVQADGKAKVIMPEIIHWLFPEVDLRRTVKCRIPFDGKVDAMAIAYWLAMQERKE